KSIATVSRKSETKFIGDNDKCRVQYSLSYDAYLFNGAFAPLKLRLDGNIAKTPYYDTNKLVTIHDANNDEVLVEFVHDFSREDLDLLPVTVSIMKNFQNKNILFINNLKVQDDKTMFLEKIRPVSKAVCVLNEEVEDVNQLIRECTKLSCPGDKIIGDSNVSCILDENKFTIFGLKYSGVIEEWECGDNWCDIDENSLSCPSDCNEFCGNNICGVGENTTNCSADCKPAPSTGSSGGTSGGSSGWSTKPVTCTTNASCGEVSYVGEKYCDGSVVYQKAKIPTCINPSRTDSNCIIVEKDLNVMECSNSQTCKSGKCIENQVNYDSIACTTTISCKDNEECLDGYCKEIVCAEGWISREHECFCEGTHCTAKLLEDNGVVDSNLLNEETGTFDIIPILIGLFILLIIIIIIAALFWFFVIKKKKKEEIPTQ
ncbi:MAG TPA: hypothetical protein PKK60_04505, partial [archaeon]|nr:hypothetical protein [archaeon]